MTEETIAFIPLWMLISTSLGFMIGWLCGDEARRRIHAEDRLNELSQPKQTLQQILSNTQVIEQNLLQQRRVLNDAHKRITAVSKGLQKPAP